MNEDKPTKATTAIAWLIYFAAMLTITCYWAHRAAVAENEARHWQAKYWNVVAKQVGNHARLEARDGE